MSAKEMSDSFRLPNVSIKKTIKVTKIKKKKLIINPDNYSDKWIKEIQEYIKGIGGKPVSPEQVIKVGAIAKKHINGLVKKKLGKLQAELKELVEEGKELREVLNDVTVKYLSRYDKSGIHKKISIFKEGSNELNSVFLNYVRTRNKIRRNNKYIRKVVYDVLIEEVQKIRSFGGTVKFKDDVLRPHKVKLLHAVRHIPSDWIFWEKDNIELRVRNTNGRGFYDVRTDTLYLPKDSFLSFDICLHVLLHKIERSYKPLADIQAQLWWNSKNMLAQKISWLGAPYNHIEVGIKSSFPDRYISKYYGDDDNFEIIPIGVSAIYDLNGAVSPRIKYKRSYMNFCLGALLSI